MKLFLAFLGGFGLTLASFGGGIALAVVYFSAEPVREPGPSLDTADTWPSEPVRVRRSGDLQRLPDRPPSAAAPQEAKLPADGQGGAQNSIDLMTTTAVDPQEASTRPDEEGIEPDDELSALRQAHLDWCSRRYNSYQPDDNSYQPYRGGRRPCISPHLREAAAMTGARAAGADAPDQGDNLQAEYIEPAGSERPVAGMMQEHIRSCFARYRSYRAADNTYQPYGGGPRRQCR